MEHRLPPTKLTLTLTLTLTLNPKPYQALESLDWVERVERRWELRQHSPYAHLAQDGRLAASDALVDTLALTLALTLTLTLTLYLNLNLNLTLTLALTLTLTLTRST